MIYDPPAHEPLCEDAWDERAARAFIERTVRDTEAAFDPVSFWPLHPEDRYGEEPGGYRGVYSGAAGTMWALDALSKTAEIALHRHYGDAIAACEDAYRANPWDTGGVVPGFFMGTTGIMAARYVITQDERVLERLERDIRSNRSNPTNEIFWGASGSALAALLIRERTGTNRFDGVLREVQDELWSAWPVDGEHPLLWLQDMYGKQQRYVGAGHGAFGNLAPFLRAGDLLAPARRAEVHERVVRLLDRYALRDDRGTNWISMAQPWIGNRMQWCHGAPGIVMALAPFPRGDARVEEALLRGGEAIWSAGPLAKGPTFCHGTAGNGYALLRLAQRTGDAVWLERARRFAVHAMGQVDRWREQFGMPSFSLWSGEPGVALFVQGVLNGDAAVLGLDAR